MDLIFIYYNNLKFQDNKIFTIKFSNGDRLDRVLFKRKKDYNLVSMSCFIEITNNLSKLTHYNNIKKISDLSNSILKNGVDHSYEEKNLEVTFNDLKIEMTSEKCNRALLVEIVEFFAYVTKQKRLVFIYSPYKVLKQFGLKFENKNNSHIGGYTVTLKEENDKLYLEKELFFNEDKLLKNLIKENDNKNVIFMKYQGKIYLFKLELTKAFLKKTKDKDKQKFQPFLNRVVFLTGITTYRYLMGKSMAYANWRYPITLVRQYSIIFGGVNLYLSPELYVKNKSFMRDFKENGKVRVTSDMLQFFRRQLNDQSYNVSKIYTFKNLFTYSKVIIKEDDFVLPDFNIHVKLKDQSSKESVKKTLKFSYSILESDKKVKKPAPSENNNLSGQAEYIKNPSKKVNLKSLTHA